MKKLFYANHYPQEPTKGLTEIWTYEHDLFEKLD